MLRNRLHKQQITVSQHECFTKSNVNPQDTRINGYIRWSALAKQFQVKYKNRWNIIKSNPLLKGAGSYFGHSIYCFLNQYTLKPPLHCV